MDRSGIIGGVVGGVVGGLITARLVKPPEPKPVTITSKKDIIEKKQISAETILLPKTTYHFAIILFHGDGDQNVTLTVAVDNISITLAGNEQAIELLANQNIEIKASGNGYTPVIEILSLGW